MDRPSTAYGALSALADQVVGIEWPVHVCELVNRVRDAGGLKRADGRIQQEVEKAVEVSVRDGRLAKDSGFLTIPGRMPRVRDRGEVRSTSLHKCDRLPPWELDAATLGVVRNTCGRYRRPSRAGRPAARAVGFKATSGQLRDLLAEVISAAVRCERMTCRNGMMVSFAAANKDGSTRAPTRRPMAP